jgi:hypothetical protein
MYRLVALELPLIFGAIPKTTPCMSPRQFTHHELNLMVTEQAVHLSCILHLTSP